MPSPVQPPLVTLLPAAISNTEASDEYERWSRHNLLPQRQASYAVVWIKLPVETVLTHQFRGLADLLDKHHLRALRIAINQDLVIPWTPITRIKEIYNDLRALHLATPGTRTISDVTGCPGATTCNLGITLSEQTRAFGHGMASELGPVRFDLVAEGFGCYGVRVATGEELLPALREGLTRNCPTVIHVPIVRSSPAD